MSGRTDQGRDPDTDQKRDPERGSGREESAEFDPDDGPAELSDLFDELEALEDLVESPAAREQMRETMRVALDVGQPGTFGRVIRGFDRGDVAEALLGSLVFGIPMFVEGGTNEVGTFVASHPAFLLATHAFAFVLVVGVLYVADIQDVRIHRPLFGVVPRRLVGVLGVPLLTAAVMMTAWGRVDWADPWLAVCTISVAFVPMAIGAALGDILPGS
jgi:uncharacterized membrane protein